MARAAQLPRFAPGLAVAVTAVLAGGCLLGSHGGPRTSGPHAHAGSPAAATGAHAADTRHAGGGTDPPGKPALDRSAIGQLATSGVQVARAVAAFAAEHPAMSPLGCTAAAIRDVTSINRDAAQRSLFPLLPDLVQCGELAVAELPLSADFGPAPFVLSTCAGSTGAPLETVPTIGGANWVIWPWYGERAWMSASLAAELAADLGLSPSEQPYTLSLESAPTGSATSAAADPDPAARGASGTKSTSRAESTRRAESASRATSTSRAGRTSGAGSAHAGATPISMSRGTGSSCYALRGFLPPAGGRSGAR